MLFLWLHVAYSVMQGKDSEGEEEWIKTFGEDGSEFGHSVQQTSDGGYIILGSLLIKTDSIFYISQ